MKNLIKKTIYSTINFFKHFVEDAKMERLNKRYNSDLYRQAEQLHELGLWHREDTVVLKDAALRNDKEGVIKSLIQMLMKG